MQHINCLLFNCFSNDTSKSIYNFKETPSNVEETDTTYFYTDINQTTKIATNLTVDEVLEKYEDKLSQYKYTFKLDDGNYYFYSVERVK